MTRLRGTNAVHAYVTSAVHRIGRDFVRKTGSENVRGRSKKMREPPPAMQADCQAKLASVSFLCTQRGLGLVISRTSGSRHKRGKMHVDGRAVSYI